MLGNVPPRSSVDTTLGECVCHISPKERQRSILSGNLRSVASRQLKALTLNHTEGPIACYSHEEDMYRLHTGSKYVMMRQEIEIPMLSVCYESMGDELARDIIRMVEKETPYYDRAIYSFQVNTVMREERVYIASFYTRTDFDRISDKVKDMGVLDDDDKGGEGEKKDS